MPTGVQWQCRAPLSTAIGSKVQFPKHIRESVQGHAGRCEKPLISSASLRMRVAYSSSVWRLQKNPRPIGQLQALPASQIPQQGWVEVSPQGAGTEPALSYQPGSVKQGRGERVNQSIWNRPTNSERCLKKKPDQGIR